MTADRTERLGHESIPYLIFTFSLPAIVGMMAQGAYNLVDRIFVGRSLGTDAIAGTAVSFPFMLVLIAFSMLIGLGAAALISIRLGQQQREEAEQVLGNAAVLLLGASLLVTIIGWMLLDPLLIAFGAGETVLPYARDYLGIIVLGSVFQIVSFGLNAAIRAEGNPRIAMYTMLIGVLLNTILAPLFLFGLGWGMKGAALATVLSQGVSAVWVVGHFLSSRSHLRLRIASLRLRGPLCVQIVIIGSPPFAMQMAASVMNGLLNNQLRVYGGVVAISIMGIIYVVAMMIAMPIFGINQGAQPIIGYNYGAERFDRVKKALQMAVLGATGIALGGYAVVMLFPQQVIRLFNRDDVAMAAIGPHALRASLLMLPVIGFQVISANYFQAVGKPRQAMLLMLSRQVLLLIPAVLLLPRFFGLNGVWAAMPTADLGSALLTGLCLFLELRHLHRRHVASQSTVPLG